MRRKKPTPESQDQEGPVSRNNGDTIRVIAPKKGSGRFAVSLEPKKPEPDKKPDGKERLHKQPRAMLKTLARTVGKNMQEPSLFSLQGLEEEAGEIGLYKERQVISRNTAVLAEYILKQLQATKGESLIIENLSPLAELLGQSNYEIKIYLLNLGGFTYPITDIDEDNNLVLTVEQLFHVSFMYDKELIEEYRSGAVKAISGGGLSFLKDRPFKQITVTPNSKFLQGLQGKGLGNVLVNDGFLSLGLELTDTAYKILKYSASNRPKQKIGLEKFITQIGLERQAKTQGRPRILNTILAALQELQDKGHITSFSYDPEAKLFSFAYSNRYVKHREGRTEEKPS
jgi:hypothetical protein